MFWILILVAIFGFAIQSVLTSHLVRKIDTLSGSMYRSISLIFIMLPILFFADLENLPRVLEYQHMLIPAAISAAFATWFGYSAIKKIPMGISASFKTITSVLTSLLLGWFFFQEYFTIIALASIVVMLVGGVIVSNSNTDFDHLDNDNLVKGVLYSLVTGVFGAVTVFLMISVSRELGPYLTGYFWELEIAICLIIFVLIRKAIGKGKIEKISRKQFGMIALAASPTLFATASTAIAGTLGDFAVISVMMTLIIVVVTILGALFFKEKLNTYQYIGIFIIFLGAVGVRIFA